MARTNRYHNPGSSYHVMLRGNNGQDIFYSDLDRGRMCFLLQEGIERYGHRIHAFCFMRNHIHLLIQVGTIPLSKIIHNLAFRYSQKINRKHGKIGHLFQGRFKAVLIQDNAYFKRLLRYIHRNPVRANIVKNPEDYAWSGHRVYLDHVMISWLTTEYGLSKFDAIKEVAKECYSKYVLKDESDQELEELRQRFKDGQVLGDDIFLAEVRETNERNINKKEINLPLNIVFSAVCDVFGVPGELILSQGKFKDASFARAATAKIAKEQGNISIVEIAHFLNRDESTISSLLSRLNRKCVECFQTRNMIDKIKEKALQFIEL